MGLWSVYDSVAYFEDLWAFLLSHGTVSKKKIEKEKETKYKLGTL